MADTINIPPVILEDSVLNVTDKLKLLTNEALGSDSIYMRAKDTFRELLDDKNLTKTDYAQQASQFISQLAIATTQQVITGAINWAIKEKEMAYSLAKMKSEIQLDLAQVEQIKANIVKTDKDIELSKANVTATLANSIRKNGRVETYAADGYTPLTLMNEGAEYTQMLAIDANKYATLADSYRKSGVVEISTTADGVTKGISGNLAGYTEAQEEFARRQIKSFEDSKRNHAANAMCQMIGQMLSAETAPLAEDVNRWRQAIDYLNTNTPS